MNWYCVSAIGVAELCCDEEHASRKALDHNTRWFGLGPFRAVQLVDAAEIDALKARIAELEAELAAVGAGGVQPMRGGALTSGEIVAQWLCDALFGCIKASGIIRNDIGSLSVAELLFFSRDLKGMLERQAAPEPVEPSDAQIALLDPWMRPAAAKELLKKVLAIAPATPAQTPVEKS